MTAAALLATMLLVTTGAAQIYLVLVGLGSLVAGAAFILAARGQGETAVQTATYGASLLATVFLVFANRLVLVPIGVEVLLLLAVLSAFLTSSKNNATWGLTMIAVLLVTAILRANRMADEPTALTMGITHTLHFVLLWGAATQVNHHLRESRMALSDRLRDIDAVVDQARLVAKGDLTGGVEMKNNEVAEVIGEMIEGLRVVVGEVQEGVAVLATASTNIDSMAAQQQRGAVHQSSAVSETRETIQSLAAASRKIHEATEGVLANARSTQQTNERANEQLNALANHTRRINELLELVKEISSKSEILALNAALEGTKAGEAGRGFSLVAAQMQRLAEDTANAIKDVKALTTDITRSTSATVLSMEEATKLARDTTVAAQQISLITQQQSSGAEQVLEAMNDVATVTEEFADSAQDALTAISELKSLSERLNKQVHRFVL